ncbi:MAG: LUD domain-containing protein, partial [Candidatus Bathyarchaeia archaeon]
RILQFMPEVMLCYKPVPVPHIKREKIAHRLSEKLCKEVAPTPEGIVYAARDDVVEALSKTKIGITGANAIAAQEGAISFCFDQMNITRVTHLPTHIAIAGIEKLVPTMLDAMKVVYLLSFYEGGTGAQCYLTIRGPSLSADVERQLVPGVYGAKDVHLVLLDNGRKQMIEEGFEQALYCIRCFACANYCPIHEVLGPGAGFGCETPGFGYKGYCGGQGIILTAFTQGVEKAIDSGLYLCTLCESCVKHCPLEIEAPRMIKKLRKKVAKELGGEV